MPEYRYTALNTEDEKITGAINAVDFNDAVAKLKRQKKFPLTVVLIYKEGLSSEEKIEYRKRYGMQMESQDSLAALIDGIRRKIRLRSYKKKEELKRQRLLVRKSEITNRECGIRDDTSSALCSVMTTDTAGCRMAARRIGGAVSQSNRA